MKIITVLGARPQFIKAAALSRVFRQFDAIQEKLIHTGQHFDANMSDVFFEEMDIPKPNWQLNINGIGHGAMTGRMLEAIEDILILEKPDYVLVYGDTNSTLAGALAAQKLHIPVVHVEAGLRSLNMKMPEEVNRILTDRISSMLFCPTTAAVNNLKREGFDAFNCSIYQSGDVMQDAATYYASQLGDDTAFLEKHDLESGKYVLATIHRQENTDDPNVLRQLFSALSEINESVPVVLPLHPRTRQRIEKAGIRHQLRILEPQGYFDMIRLIRNSRLVMTDSGGLQKEAYFFRKFCITLREQTEWIELVEHGVNRVCGSDPNEIMDAFNSFTKSEFVADSDLYGGGAAAQYIADKLLSQS